MEDWELLSLCHRRSSSPSALQLNGLSQGSPEGAQQQQFESDFGKMWTGYASTFAGEKRAFWEKNFTPASVGQKRSQNDSDD